MWARISECFFGVWLILSPWVFGSPSYLHELIVGMLILFFSLLSYGKKLSKMHLFNLFIGVWLFFLGIFEKKDLSYGMQQNYFVVALLLLLFGIIPSWASDHPTLWVEFYEKPPKD